ncbi:TPA: DNA ligase, partial [Escherichia coli]
MKKLIALKHKLDEMKAIGTNAKKEALANMDDFEQSMVSLMLNPFIRFGVKKYKVAEPLSESIPSDVKAIDVLNKLASRELTGNAAIAAVESIVASMCADGQDVFRRFL